MSVAAYINAESYSSSNSVVSKGIWFGSKGEYLRDISESGIISPKYSRKYSYTDLKLSVSEFSSTTRRVFAQVPQILFLL